MGHRVKTPAAYIRGADRSDGLVICNVQLECINLALSNLQTNHMEHLKQT